MLEALPRARWSNSYRLLRDGLLLAEIGPALRCQVDGQAVLGRSRLVRFGRYGRRLSCLLEVNGRVMAEAQPRGVGRGWTIVPAGSERAYRLRPRRPLAMTFVLEEDGILLGTIRPQGRWLWGMRKAVIELPGLPLPLALFVFWLVITTWHTQHRDGGGGAM
ncbi:hypothetical protein [Thermogemmatispora sp.]|uniref:hypothetical protein n=1 Tax=Thermogemmatispora sp. TaxID=1968838 RepID=UPI0035E4275D